MALKYGDIIPAFQTLDAFGNLVSDKDLKGVLSVLYFYPRDNTPRCTQEACEFQEAWDAFATRKVQIIGVSPDGAAMHRKFIEKHHLRFTLLTDEGKEIAKAFGVLKEKNLFGMKKLAVERTTFLIDASGAIVWAESDVRVPGHVARVILAMQTLQT